MIELGKRRYNADWLRSVSEETAIRTLRGNDRNQVINAWKQANGLTVRTRSKSKKKKESDDK